jgi:hypothetical protein
VVDQPAPDDRRRPKILIPDNTPISLLGSIGALDWLFVPKCELWMTDMVMEEALRDPDSGRDRRLETRAFIGRWITQNRYCIKRLTTAEGERYLREMAQYEQAVELWRLAGEPPQLLPVRPEWTDRGEASVLRAVQAANAILAMGESVVVLADDRDARAALKLLRADIDLMGTQTFTRWLAEDFQVAAAETAWQAIEVASRRGADPGETDDPVYIRNRLVE